MSQRSKPAGAREIDERFARRATYDAAGVQEVIERAERRMYEAMQERDNLREENLRLRAAIASTQTYLGNLVREIHKCNA